MWKCDFEPQGIKYTTEIQIFLHHNVVFRFRIIFYGSFGSVSALVSACLFFPFFFNALLCPNRHMSLTACDDVRFNVASGKSEIPADFKCQGKRLDQWGAGSTCLPVAAPALDHWPPALKPVHSRAHASPAFSLPFPLAHRHMFLQTLVSENNHFRICLAACRERQLKSYVSCNFPYLWSSM